MNEVLREFLLETLDSLAQLDLDLVTLEKEPKEEETLARAFRTLHTVKGTSGFLGFAKLQAVGHAAESLLSLLRSGELAFNAEIAGTLLGVVDAIRRMLASIEQTEKEGDGDYSALIKDLERLRNSESVGSPWTVAVPPSVGVSPQRSPAGEDGPGGQAPPGQMDQAVGKTRAWSETTDHPGGQAPSPSPSPTLPTIAGVAAGPPPVTVQVVEPAEPRASAVSDSAIRVDVGLLDKLMTLVGELVLARNQIMQFSTSQEDAAFLGTVQRLNLLTTELQANVMKTRMQPIGNIWNKFPRVVRDLAVACGKQARIEMEGQETELDKTIIEAIRDPLTHLVRNADRPRHRAAGRARRAGQAGRGPAVAARLPRGRQGHHRDRRRRRRDRPAAASATRPSRPSWSRPSRPTALTDRELVNLIFLPGFSTADRVTQFSGRGVGMDVVRTNVEKIGGTVDIESRLGPRHHRQDEDPADPGDHPGPDRHQRRRPLRDPAGQPAGAGPSRRRAGPARRSS